MIGVGDAVTAIRDGGRDKAGLPLQRPVRGGVYRVTGIYEMRYGLGCTLQGMDPAPYKGYLLLVRPGIRAMREGWYFKKIEKADNEFSEWLYSLRPELIV